MASEVGTSAHSVSSGQRQTPLSDEPGNDMDKTLVF